MHRPTNPYGRDIIEAERGGRRAEYLTCRELSFLAGVGAIEYLRQPCSLLDVALPTFGATIREVPVSKWVSGGAFRVYAKAERLALKSMDASAPEEQRYLRNFAESCVPLLVHQRVALARKPGIKSRKYPDGARVPLPGRGTWWIVDPESITPPDPTTPESRAQSVAEVVA